MINLKKKKEKIKTFILHITQSKIYDTDQRRKNRAYVHTVAY